jgi:hypothetical protein
VSQIVLLRLIISYFYLQFLNVYTMEILLETLPKYLYNIAIVFILARFLYYPRNGQREYMFTYIILSAVLGILCIMVKRVELGFGLALGIFAVFSLLRYRTISISIRDMTYLFLCAGITTKNSLTPDDTEFFRLFAGDVVLVILVTLGEFFLFRDKIVTKTILYNNLNLIHPDRKQELLNDLNKQFGISEVKKVQIGRIDTIKGSARIKVTFKDMDNANLPDE